MRRAFLIGLLLSAAALACNFPGLAAPPTRTPLPSITPSGTAVPLNNAQPTASATPPASPAPVTPTPGHTPTPTSTSKLPPTPTQRPVVVPNAGGPLNITNVPLVSVQRDPSRTNGAIAKIKIEFTGGRSPYTYYEEGVRQRGNPVNALTACGATLVHTVRVDSADGQTDSQSYYFDPIVCPP